MPSQPQQEYQAYDGPNRRIAGSPNDEYDYPQQPQPSHSTQRHERPQFNIPNVSFSPDEAVPPPRGSSRYNNTPPIVPPKDPSPTGYSDIQPLYATQSNDRLTPGDDPVRRKKSLVRPERSRMNRDDRNFHYVQHAAQLESDGRIAVVPSATGNLPSAIQQYVAPQPPPFNRGKSFLDRDENTPVAPESGLAIFGHRSHTIRRKNRRKDGQDNTADVAELTNEKGAGEGVKTGYWSRIAPGPVDGWMIYCYLLTLLVPEFLLRAIGKRTPDAQRAWREKMGLISIIICLMAIVAFLTFGFTQAVCGVQPEKFEVGSVGSGSLIVNGDVYELAAWQHPAVSGTALNGSTSPLYVEPWVAGGMDASFLFQNTNDKCLGIITPTSNSDYAHNAEEMEWYFPCNLRNQYDSTTVDTSNQTISWQCHTTAAARTGKTGLGSVKPSGQVYFSWADVKNTSRNVAVYNSKILDFNLLQWLQSNETQYPKLFDYLKTPNATYQGQDVTMTAVRTGQTDAFDCLSQIITVGVIDSISIGCIASDVVLYASLAVILGVVMIKFCMACIFGWFLSWRIGSYTGLETYAQRMARSNDIENWTDDIYRPAPGRYRPNVKERNKGGKTQSKFLPSSSRFSKADSFMVTASRPITGYGPNFLGDSGGSRKSTVGSIYGLSGSPSGFGAPSIAPSSTSLAFSRDDSASIRNPFSDNGHSNCPFPLQNVIPQPPPDFEPFNFPLMYNLCLVTAYSESVEGLRTTIDSLATTDYPNSHKCILVICDGMVRGSGSKLRTPDIVLGMMKELVVPPEEVEPHSYVAIADGHKRHNMAKVFAGFYDYDDNTVEVSKQQRVPIILVAKVGNPLEVNEAKPGNRGKRDSQIMLMGFLQKVMFDERMSKFEYEFFNALWRVTGIAPDKFVGLLCVDADTKVFPDSLTRMTATLVADPEIMGLCGETKVANKRETWVTMIQVFEYYISHHQIKAFEAIFGGVTCLPGCFSMYRIKAPKVEAGINSGYWVPILANPDIVEHYSENVVDTLHKKNLLLLGEDRYLSTLLLKTFPKRKMVFVPQAVCKTVVPDTFRVLLSQRRRWINSTVHNLFELLFVRDLCGTFCFSMQFVVFMDLVGTLVLPAAISFTLYLIIDACIPGRPTPTISLILLAFILGLPAVLIGLTSRKFSYFGWMILYLFSLPVWNFVLPMYAFWNFDDFSWGETRKVEGEGVETDHGAKDGTFDSSHIIMKRWVDFERERRWRTASRDSVSFDGHYSQSSSTEYYGKS